MRIKNKDVNLSVVVLLALTAAMALANYFWLKMNLRPPIDDEAVHLLSAMKYFRILEQPFPDLIGRLLVADGLYPPLFPFLAACGARLFGVWGTIPFCMTNILFLAVTFVSLYGIGVKMGDRRAGVLASCFLLLYPMFFQLSRMFMLEVALVAMVTMTMLLLLNSQGFNRTLWSVLAGISLGLGMLTKQTYVVFVVGPVLYGLAGSWKDLDGKQKRKRIVNFCLFVAVGIAIASPWYFADGGRKFLPIRNAFFSKDSVVFNSPDSLLGALVFYLKTLVHDQMGWLFCGAFIVAVLARLKKLVASPFLLIWIVVPYFVFMMFPNKYYYYTLACLPAAALITASGFLSVKNAALRWIVISVLLLLGTGQYLSLSFMLPQAHSKILYFANYSPVKRDFHVQTLLKRITEESQGEELIVAAPEIDPNIYSGEEDVRIGENYALINWDTLKYLVALEAKPWTIKRIPDLETDGFKTRPDFIICHGNIEKTDFPVSYKALYRLMDVFVMPDMSHVYLYKLEKSSASRGEQAVVHREDPRADLDNGLLQLASEGNDWRIFWKGRVIAKKLLVIAALKPFRIWNDSKQCWWRILSLDGNRLRARAYTAFFFPAQEWEFVLDGNRIYWTVKVFGSFWVRSEWEEVNVLLTGAYRRWITARGAGDFPQAFSPNDYKEKWQPLASGGPLDAGYVGVEQVGDALPSVTFYSLRSRIGLKGQVVNVDGYSHGKVLQYVFRWPWRYDSFQGCLVIGDRDPKFDSGSDLAKA